MNALGILGQTGKAMIAPAARAVAPEKAAQSYGRTADKKLLQAIKQDSLTPQRIAQTPQFPGKPETIMERAGRARGGADNMAPNVTALADSAMRFPGPQRTLAADTISERLMGQGERVGDDIAKAFGVSGDPYQVAKQLDAARRAAAKPLYDQAYQQGGVISHPSVIELVRTRPTLQSAYSKALKTAADNGVDVSQFPKDPRKVQALPMQILDYVKTSADDILGANKTNLTGTKAVGREMAGKVAAKEEFVSALDALVPTYAQARAAWAGPTVMRKALEDGQEFHKLTADQLRRQMASMTPAEAEQFKVGALAGIRQRISETRDGGDLVKTLYGSPERRRILEEMVGPAFPDLEKKMMAEKLMRRVDDKLRGGSQTAERLTGMDDVGAEPVLQALRSGGATAAVIDYALRSGRGQSQPTAEALGPLLFATDPAAQAAMLRRLTKLDKRMMRSAGVTGTMGGGLGAYSLLDD
jgi:hypothetical protein